ncbi:MAG: penicillin acylase family protein, partial [Solirubrobacterales bacterium]|nr:penicillin acylase family protein [Solirubrobacterales bacterium]
MTMVVTAALAVAALPAGAKVLSAQTGLPPGQSGFVSVAGLTSGTGSPHLYDQLANFTTFRWKPAGFGQPGATETVRPGLTVTRDAYGVPSVTASSEHDMWLGAGYAVAQDRLFQLNVFRRATQGTLSALIGKARLDDDRIVRRDFYTPAELDRMYAALPASLQDRFAAYRDGINLWVAHVQANPQDLPAEFVATAEPLPTWTTRDSVAIGVYLARTIATNADPESLELSNLRGVQLGGATALQALVPLRTARAQTTIPAREGGFPSQPGRTRGQERAAARRSIRFAKTLPFPDAAGAGALGTP